MAERTLSERERYTVAGPLVTTGGTRDILDEDMDTEMRELEQVSPPDAFANAAMTTDGANVLDGSTYVSPGWMSRATMLPVSVCDTTCIPYVEDCCLFFPLQKCSSNSNIHNGFCEYHLKAIFNVVITETASFMARESFEPQMYTRIEPLVAIPQRLDDRVTRVFPLFDLFENEPKFTDINLTHLRHYLRKQTNWKEAYDAHVNYLYELVTVRLRNPTAAQDQQKQLQMLTHWDAWNATRSQHLAMNAANLFLIYARDDRATVIPVNRMCTISQMILRLFELPYTSFDDKRFFSTVPNYGVYANRYLAFQNNLCTSGTAVVEVPKKKNGDISVGKCSHGKRSKSEFDDTTEKDFVCAYGNPAYISMFRDACREPPIRIKSKRNCHIQTVVPKYVNWNSLITNQSTLPCKE